LKAPILTDGKASQNFRKCGKFGESVPKAENYANS